MLAEMISKEMTTVADLVNFSQRTRLEKELKKTKRSCHVSIVARGSQFWPS